MAFATHLMLNAQPKNAPALFVAPELIIEVVSPVDTWDEIMTKLTEYFAIGVKHVWIVTPSTQTLQDYTFTVSVVGHSPEDRPMVSCPGILPGFELDLQQVF